MLRLTEIQLRLPKNIHLHSSMGSVMHGALMEAIDSETAAALHTIALRPYSQCVYYDKNRNIPIWRIGTLNDTAYEQIVRPLLQHDRLFLKQKNYAVFIENEATLQCTTYENIADAVFQKRTYPSGVDMSFLTTTSFKHDGMYDIFPDPSRIFYSLICRWNTFSEEILLKQDGLEQTLTEACCMGKYSLRSQPYSLEGRDLYGFCGNLRLRFTGNDMTSRLMGLLLCFAPFAGIGAKTALGMGALRTHLRY